MIIKELKIKGKLLNDIRKELRFRESERYWHLDVNVDKETIKMLRKEFVENGLDKNTMLPKWFKEEKITDIHVKSKFDFDCYYNKFKVDMSCFVETENELYFTKNAEIKLIAGLSDNGALYPIALEIVKIDNSNPFEDFE